MSGCPLSVEDVAWFREGGATMPGAVRRAARDLAERLGLGASRASEIALAVTEAAENVHRHSVDGAVLLRALRTGGRAGVELVTVDHGPGMANVAASRRDGVSSTGTLGIGLGVIERVSDAFDLHSVPDRGTVLTARFWAGGPPEGAPGHVLERVGGVTRPITGEQVCGDAWAARETGGMLMVMVCDGLGHGPLAADASAAAVEAFCTSDRTEPELVMDVLHRALRRTRGGAAAVVRVDPRRRTASFCGVGNIAGALVREDGRSGMTCVPGIVGHQMRRLRSFDYPLDGVGALVLHSDGLTERWQPSALPGMLDRSPLVVAGQLLREAGVRRDDAAVVAVSGAW
ncbi:ATP-binding SpoIIE family protein phosphatase [Streptomyces sp. NPDC059637]|uniref:ATP-binding SpoIIE family protein phosphatase n=1 Tax=Streptomyces sp. NPDC059637 TaxID=3347752 RepID=UPI00367BC2EE